MSIMDELWEETEVDIVCLLATALDALVEQGLQITPEQYKRALVKAARKDVAPPCPELDEALDAAIDEHLDWWHEFYHIEEGSEG